MLHNFQTKKVIQEILQVTVRFIPSNTENREVGESCWWHAKMVSVTYTILPKVLGHLLLMNMFDCFSNFYEYKS